MSSKWDTRFLSLAEHIAGWSKDPSTRVGAVIVDNDNRVVSIGYNGFAQGVVDAHGRLSDRTTRLRMTLHAEENAVLTAESRRIQGGRCYIWPLPPCAHCAAVLIQAGVKSVIALEPSPELRERWGDELTLAIDQFREAGVSLRLVEP